MCRSQNLEIVVFSVKKNFIKALGGGGLLQGKKDRDDHRKSKKTTLKNTKP